MRLFDYRGVIHFHSAYSFDGSIPIDRIIYAAKETAINFLLLTDHDHMRARDEGWEGWNNDVLLIVGQEIAPRFNHYLAFNTVHPISCPEDAAGIIPQIYIDKVNADGGFGFIAHPDHEGTKTFHVKHYPWVDWSVDGYAGISIWDFMTDWQSSLNGYFKALLSFLFPAFFLKGPRPVTLQRWDSLNLKKKTVGIGELDNHASQIKFFGLSITALPFDQAFKFIHTRVLTKEPFNGNNDHDISLVLDALHYGRCYTAMEYFRDACGFNFYIEHDGQQYYMGDTLTLSKNAQLKINLPDTAIIRVIRNGNLLAEDVKKDLILDIVNSGVYRVEVYLKSFGKYRPWIFSNNIFVN